MGTLPLRGPRRHDGHQDTRLGSLPEGVSPEDLVPKNRFYRRLEATLDLSFMGELMGPLYARGGRPSVDRVDFSELQPVMPFEDLGSERRLMRVVADRLSL